MARPQKLGIDYFPLDVDIDQDDKIQLVEALHGTTGFAVIIKLFMRIYKEGYFYKWTETEQLLFSRRVNVDINTLTEIVNDCIKYELFCPELYEKYRILTSAGIQQRYFEASKRRKSITVINQFLLVEPSKIINANINRVNADIEHTETKETSTETPQSKVKESKEEKSKERRLTNTSLEQEETPFREPVIKVDDGFAELNKFYQSNIGPVTPHIGDLLSAWCDDYGTELALHALKVALETNAGNKVKYAETVLRNWKSRRFMTVADVMAAEERRSQSKVYPFKKASGEESLYTPSEATLERQRRAIENFNPQQITDDSDLPF